MKIGDLMMRDPPALLVGESAARAARVMREHDLDAVPVVDDLRNRRLQGMVMRHDVAPHVAEPSTGMCPVGDIMRSPWAVYPDMELDDVRGWMRLEDLAFPVVDSTGRLMGLLATAVLDLSDGFRPRTSERRASRDSRARPDGSSRWAAMAMNRDTSSRPPWSRAMETNEQRRRDQSAREANDPADRVALSRRPENFRPRPGSAATDKAWEAMGTDGKGTGGMGADLGGYDPLPEDAEIP